MLSALKILTLILGSALVLLLVFAASRLWFAAPANMPSTPVPAELTTPMIGAATYLETHRFLIAPPSEPSTQPEFREESFSAELPEPYIAFDRWARSYATASSAERTTLLPEGLKLVAARSEHLSRLLAENPEAAILFTPSPAVRRTLPPEIETQLERIIAAKGFYGVKAICNHGPEVPHSEQTCRIEHEVGIGSTLYQASIYGSREDRLTEEKASLYGVALDGRIALHQDDYVVLPGEDIDPTRTGQLAVIHNGETTWFPDPATLESHFRQPAQP